MHRTTHAAAFLFIQNIIGLLNHCYKHVFSGNMPSP